MNRREDIQEQERMREFKENKQSHMRFKEEHDRGFDILTNDPLKGPEASKGFYQTKNSNPPKVWSRAMRTVNDRKLLSISKAL